MAIGKNSATQENSGCKPGTGHTVAFGLGAFDASSLDAPVQIIILGSKGDAAAPVTEQPHHTKSYMCKEPTPVRTQFKFP